MGSPTVIAIAVVRRDEEVLIGRRPEGVPLAGLWEFPGGKVQPDEEPRQAAARECLEETGLAVQVGTEYPTAIHEYAHGRVDLRFFACEAVKRDQSPLPPFAWVRLADLRDYDFPAANAALLDVLLK